MTTNFKQDNPGCGADDCCGGCTPPTCSLTGTVIGSQIQLNWSVGGSLPITAVLSSNTGDVYTLTVPPTSGSVLTPSSTCRLWTLNVSNACGSTSCQFSESGCTEEYLRTEECETCAETDYPSSLLTPLRQVQVTISGATGGTNSAAPNYYNNDSVAPLDLFWSEYGPEVGQDPGFRWNDLGNCEVSALGTNASFFNTSVVLDACTNTVLYDCRYICSALLDLGFLTSWLDFYEWNRLEVSYQPLGGGAWEVVADLEAWVFMYGSPGGVPGDNCTELLDINIDIASKRPKPPPEFTYFGAWLSYRRKTLAFELNGGIKKGYWYNPATCASGCNPDVDLEGCLPSGLSTSTASSTLSTSYYCTKAVNVNSASALVTVL